MSHVRTQIRDAFVAKLTSLATTGARVYGQRIRPPAAALPFLLVYLGTDEGERITVTDDAIEQRTASLIVRAFAKANGDMEDTLDQIALEVHDAIGSAADQTFGGLIKSLGAPSIDPDVDDSLEQPAGVNQIAFPITYFIAAINPAVAL